MSLRVSEKYLQGFVTPEEYKQIEDSAAKALQTVIKGDGAGSDFLGWRYLPDVPDREEYDRIKAAAEKIKGMCDALVVIGIGGSYLGARAAIEFCLGTNYNAFAKKNGAPEIYFAGKDLSASTISETLALLEGKEVCLNVISKSGTTTEPAIAFRIFREFMEKKYGDEAAERIFVTTDKARGKLKEFSTEKGYETFVVPDDVGGRFSVLSPVGLLPIACAGIDIDEMIKGAYEARTAYTASEKLAENDCLKYAAIRNILYGKGRKVEVLASYEPSLNMTAEWWKQLYGESEGKGKKGIFPASVCFT
ncbi:MAG: glucose-6-phosphate isomerase, partial [Clostridia bacterium]|nr:glucose-6-phosphate isomerase [Clostridia bacterium]